MVVVREEKCETKKARMNHVKEEVYGMSQQEGKINGS